MAELKIVAADGIKGSGLELLKQAFGESAIEVRGKFSEDELCEKIGDMDALLIRSGTTVTRKAIESGSRIRLIGRAGVGTDNIDKEAATERGIVVMNTPLGNTVSAAEQAIALIFATARNIARADAQMQQGNWAKKELKGVEVFEKTLGLVGLGKIGGHVAKVMQAAGMKVLAYDPFLPPERAKQLGVELADVDTLVAQSDFISLHTPLTDKTRNLMSAERLASMKKGARIINCARGGILDEAALASLVAEGHIAAAGIDVFSKEPMTEGPLFGVKDLTLTPHLGASTDEAEERCGTQMAEQVIAYFKENEIRNAVNVSLASDKSLRPYVDLGVALGKVGASLLDGPAGKIEVCAAGKLEGKDTGEITSGVVQGALEAIGAEDVNVVNADYLAKQRGIEISETSGRAVETFLSRVDVSIGSNGKQVRVCGTVYDGVNPRIVQINDFELDMRLGKYILIMTYPDRPGFVGKFGTILGGHNINIASMDVGRTEKSGGALIALSLDDKPDDAAMAEVRAVDGVETAALVTL